MCNNTFLSLLFSQPLSLQSPGKEPCQTSLEGDHSPDTPSPITPTPTTATPIPGDKARPGTPTGQHPGQVLVAPVPVPRQKYHQDDPGEVGDKLPDEVIGILDSDKPESEASTKTSSDSGIEDGKITPTSEEEKVRF